MGSPAGVACGKNSSSQLSWQLGRNPLDRQTEWIYACTTSVRHTVADKQPASALYASTCASHGQHQRQRQRGPPAWRS